MTTIAYDILGEIVDVLGNFVERPKGLNARQEFISDLGMDSIALMNFCMTLEDHFDVSIPLDRMENVETLGDLAEMIESLLDKG